MYKAMKSFLLAVAVMAISVSAYAAAPVTGEPGQLGKVFVNPYGLAPLTAVVHDGGNRLSDVSVTVHGKGAAGIDISYKVKPKSLYTYAGIPVFGLYPDYNNKVTVNYTYMDFENKSHKGSKEFTIYAAPVSLPATGGPSNGILPQVVPVTVDSKFKDRLYLMNHLGRNPSSGQLRWSLPGGAAEWDSDSYNWITDTQGEVRWYMDINQIHDPRNISKAGTTMGFHQTRDGNIIFTMAQSYAKYDLLGRKIWHRDLPKKFADASHEIIETSRGYMIRAAASYYLRADGKIVSTVRDQIIEINENGDVVDYWDLNMILDPYRDNLLLALDQGAVCLNVDEDKAGTTIDKAALEDPNAAFGDITGVGPGRNWAHVNSISYVEADDSIILSARHQGIVKIGRDKQVKWILASPEGWQPDLAKKVLKPVDAKGKAINCQDSVCEGNFDWTWTQHTAYWSPEKKTLFVFDNGDARGMDQPALPTDKYSRAVEYKIDEKKMTAQQIWEFGKERGNEWYSGITSITEYLPDRDSVLVYSASVGMANNKAKKSLIEFNYKTKKPVVELNVHTGYTGYRATMIRTDLAF